MRSQRGYTLVEVLIAFAILTLVILFTMAAFFERNRRLQQASEIMLAYQALSNEAEYWRRKDYGMLANQVGFESDVALLAPLSPYTTRVTITSGPAANTKHVTLAITWKAGQREAKLAIVRADTGAGTLW
jgi:prepilin-type N-terminal cleavage/methylation domain-containing protein